MNYPLLDPDTPPHDHDGGDCPDCWTVITLLADQILPVINAAADDLDSPTPQLEDILNLLAAHHAQFHLLGGLATLITALQPGQLGLAQPAGPAGSRQQAAATTANELLDAAAGGGVTSASALEAVWALDSAARRDVFAILAYSTGAILARLPFWWRESVLLLLCTPVPAGALHAIPAAAAVSSLIAEGRSDQALRSYTRAAAEPDLLPAMATAWTACLAHHHGHDLAPNAGGRGSGDPDRRAAATAAHLIHQARGLTMLTATRLASHVRATPDLPRVGIYLAGWYGHLVSQHTGGGESPPLVWHGRRRR